MKNSQHYSILAAVMIAPHVSAWTAVAICILFTAAGFVCARLEGKP